MIRTLIVDDQNIIRKGIEVLLTDSTEIELIGYAEDGESALREVEQTQPDVVLLDIHLPGIDGLTVADRISVKFPDTKVIMLSTSEDDNNVRQAMASSAKGYLLKNVSSKELEWSIKLVHQGYSAFKSELLTSLDLKQAGLKSNRHMEELKAVSANNRSNGASATPASKQKANSDELELLLARNQVRKKYSHYKQRRNMAFHDVNVSRVKKTMMSFEFKLLVFIILFSLSFLVFVALS